MVASTATHMTPRLSASTASDMAARNRHTSAANVPACGSGGWSRVPRVRIPPHVAVRPTAPTTASMYADSASARSSPAPLLGHRVVQHRGHQGQPADQDRHGDRDTGHPDQCR